MQYSRFREAAVALLVLVGSQHSAGAIRQKAQTLFGLQTPTTPEVLQETSNKDQALFGRPDTIDDIDSAETVMGMTRSGMSFAMEKLASQDMPQSFSDCAGSSHPICQHMAISRRRLQQENLGVLGDPAASSEYEAEPRLPRAPVSFQTDASTLPFVNVHSRSLKAATLLNMPAPAPAPTAPAPAPTVPAPASGPQNASTPAPAPGRAQSPPPSIPDADARLAATQQARTTLAQMLEQAQSSLAQSLHYASVGTGPQHAVINNVPAMWAKLLAANITGTAFPVALLTALVPSSTLPQSPGAAPSPMRRHLLQNPDETDDSDSATSAGSSSDSEADPGYYDLTGADGLETSDASADSAAASTAPSPTSSALSPTGSPSPAPPSPGLTTVLAQPAVNFTSTFYATCAGSAACSETSGLDLSAVWIDNTTLLNTAMGGDQVSGGVLQPLVVSGLLSIGLIGAAGSPLDAIPLSSMYAQLPLATGYNASDALYCVQDGGLAEALITQVSSSGMMTGAIVSCPATGPGAYYLSQHMQATASQGTAPSQGSSQGGTRAPAVFSKRREIPRVSFTTNLAAWTVQSFGVAEQQQFAETVAEFLPMTNLIVTIVNVHPGSVVFNTYVDMADGNQTAANVLANALQVSPDSVIPAAIWNASSFSSIEMMQQANPYYSSTAPSGKRETISGAGVALIVVGTLLVAALMGAGAWYGWKWQAKKIGKTNGPYQQYAGGDPFADARDGPGTMYNDERPF
ncbi:hypothetical protein WJX84_006166 [Apatococcus fuscideae]|uniref:Uncharacterized protein n=1 Tax=Apatococcus fuscideae TaxID=2026836 RepID=A0AAW1RTK0_9CHLO